MNQFNTKWISVALLCSIFTAACSNQEASPPATKAPTSSQNTTNATNPSAEPPQSSEPSPSTQVQTENTVQKNLIKQIKDSAEQGKVPESEYAVRSGDWIQIQKKWGQPDHIEFAGKGRYATYTKKGITFGINKGEAIFDVRSYHDNLHKITLSSVVDTLGKELSQTTAPGQIILNYPAGDHLLLKFIFNKPNSQEADATLDHISVYDPQGAKNNMAG